jgi:RNA-binding protein
MPPIKKPRSKTASKSPVRGTAARSGKPRANPYARPEPARTRSARDAAAPPRARAEKPRANEPLRAEPAKARPLTASQKRHLRGFTHDLKPVILVGQKGVTAALLAELDSALEHHELVKVKLADDDRESRAASIERIREHSGAELVQTIGKTASFFKRNPDRNQYPLPK